MKHIPAAFVATAGAATAAVTALAVTPASSIPGAPPGTAEHRAERRIEADRGTAQRVPPRTDAGATPAGPTAAGNPTHARGAAPEGARRAGTDPAKATRAGTDPARTDIASLLPPKAPAGRTTSTKGTGPPPAEALFPPAPVLQYRYLPRLPQGPRPAPPLAVDPRFQPPAALRPSSRRLRPQPPTPQPSHGTAPTGPCALGGPGSGVTEAALTPAGYAPATGTVHALTLFVDFPDAPAHLSAKARNAEFFPAAADYFRRSSYGRLDYRSTPVLKWLRMAHPFTWYGIRRGSSFDAHSTTGYAALSREILHAVDDEVDFRKFDLVNIVATPNAGPPATRTVLSVTFSGADTGLVTNDGVPFRNASFLWSRQNGDSAFRVLNHENAHSFGLPDLYYADDRSTPDAVGHWDLMNEDWGPTNDLLGWHKWKLGWLARGEVACLSRPGRTSEQDLRPISVPGGKKIITVPVDAHRAVVAEARESGPLDKTVCRPGVLVYQVSTDVPSGEGPTRVVDATPHSGGCHTSDPNVNAELTDAPFEAGETYTDSHSGLKITVLSRTDDGTYRVRVTTPPTDTTQAGNHVTAGSAASADGPTPHHLAAADPTHPHAADRAAFPTSHRSQARATTATDDADGTSRPEQATARHTATPDRRPRLPESAFAWSKPAPAAHHAP